jgi:hypothetical protein
MGLPFDFQKERLFALNTSLGLGSQRYRNFTSAGDTQIRLGPNYAGFGLEP